MSGATAIAVIAAQQAAEAKEAVCRLMVQSYDASKANVGQMREYADCISTLYPSAIPAEGILALKVAFVIAVVGLVWGVVIARRDSWNTSFDIAMFGFFGFFLAPAAVGFVVAVGAGIVWLFT